MAYRAITNLDELKTITAGAGREVSIALGNGSIFSVKHIAYDAARDRFAVFNEIDGTTQALTSATLYTKSTIGEALDKGALMVAA